MKTSWRLHYLALILAFGAADPLAAQSLELEFNLGYQPEFRSDAHSRVRRDTEWDISANGDIVAGRTPTSITATGRRSLPLALYYVHEFEDIAIRAGYRYTLNNFEGQMGNEDLSFASIAGVNIVNSGRVEMQNYRIIQQDAILGLRLLKLPAEIEVEPFLSRHSFSEAYSRFIFSASLVQGANVANFANSTIDSSRRFTGIAPGAVVRIPLSGTRAKRDRVSVVAEFRAMPAVTFASPIEVDRGAGALTSGSISNSVFSLIASGVQYNARLALREYAAGIEIEGDAATWRLGYREQVYRRSYQNYLTLFTFTALRGPTPIGTQIGTTLLPGGDVLGDFTVYGKEQREVLGGVEFSASFPIDLK